MISNVSSMNSYSSMLEMANVGAKSMQKSSSLESSNSDLIKSVANDITNQNGFEANAKAVKANDDTLGVLLDLKA